MAIQPSTSSPRDVIFAIFIFVSDCMSPIMNRAIVCLSTSQRAEPVLFGAGLLLNEVPLSEPRIVGIVLNCREHRALDPGLPLIACSISA